MIFQPQPVMTYHQKMQRSIMAMRIFRLLLLLIIVSCKGDSKPSDGLTNNYHLSLESDLLDSNYIKTIENFYETGKEGYLIGADSISIYYKVFEQKLPTSAIVISSGRTEAAIKYKELIYDLYQNGYSVYIHDHRGQGLSGRMTDDPDMGFVKDFQYYIDDMKEFYDRFIKPRAYEHTFLLAHSMGGAIGMTYLEQFPEDFDAAAFSSPMLGLKPPLCTVVKVFDRDVPRYAIGQHSYNDDSSGFEDNALTGSKIRYDRMQAAYTLVPEARLGGVTYTWVHESCEQFAVLFENIDHIETPFLLFSAENESIVSTSAHRNFMEKAKALGKDCQAYDIAGGRHELFIEKDQQRLETLNTTLDFFESHQRGKSK
jgi:lysophospholipase